MLTRLEKKKILEKEFNDINVDINEFMTLKSFAKIMDHKVIFLILGRQYI